MTYELRFSFDPGSGTCLWATNAEAKAQFGYPVDHWTLPLSENTRRWLQYLIAWFDTSLDWQSPSDLDDRWSDEELARFKLAARKGLELLRSELPPSQFVVVGEVDA